MSFIDRITQKATPDPSIQYIDTKNDGAGDHITDPEALAFFHVAPKFKQLQGQKIWTPRASSLYSACLRMHVIACKESKTYHRKDYTSPNLSMIFDMGHVIHYLVQNTPVVFGSRRIGYWECQACGKITHWGKPPETVCPHCGASKNAVFYREHEVKPSKDFLCSGHMDLWIDVKGGLPRLLDIKSIKDDNFMSLKAVLAEHEYQVQTYLLASEFDPHLKDKVDTQNGYVFYVCKRITAKGMPYKMFHVRQTKTSRESIMGRLDIFKQGCINYPNQLPACNSKCLSSNFESYVAKYCACVNDCKRFHEQGV